MLTKYFKNSKAVLAYYVLYELCRILGGLDLFLAENPIETGLICEKMKQK